MNYIMSYGGGVNSTAMFYLLIEKKMPLDEILFADTGSELPQTYKTVEQMKEVAKQYNIPFTVITSKLGNIYEHYFRTKSLPSIVRRDCTSKFKISPMRNYLRGKYGKEEKFTQYIGIGYEELHRVRLSDVKYIISSYPLVEAKIDRDKCIEINKAHGFIDVVKSGCWFCPFTPKQGWINLARDNPELFDKAIALEKNCSNKKVCLSSKPLWQFKMLKGQKNMNDFESPPCSGQSGCFL